MRIAIIGSGAMGCLFGSRLALSGYDITMIHHRSDAVEKIKKDGIILHLDGNVHFAKVNAVLAEDLRGAFDLIMIFTKTTASKNALNSIKHLIGKGTYLMSLQNGLGNERVLEEYAPKERIIIGVTNYPSDLLSDGEIASSNTGYVKFMPADLKENEMATAINDALKKAGFNSSLDCNVYKMIWEKLAFNAALNALTAICRVPCAGIAKREEGIKLSRSITKESALVASAYDVDVDLNSINEKVEESYVKHADHYPSMAQDVIKKRLTEVDFINGAIVRYAKDKNINVPHIETTYALLKIIEANY